MKAVILAGGYGKRLHPMTYHTPKPLLDVAGVPFVTRQIAWLKKYCITDIIISTGYRSEEFTNYIKEVEREIGVNITLVDEETPLGTAGGVKNCEEYLNKDEYFFVINGDVLTDVDLEMVMAQQMHSSFLDGSYIISVRVQNPQAYGTLKIKNNKVMAFLEKSKTPISNYINAGVYLLNPCVLNHIPKNTYYMFETNLFPTMARSGYLYNYYHNGYWIDIGTLNNYYKAYQDIKNGKCNIIHGNYSNISLGTNGLIGKEITFDNMRRIAYGVCKFYNNVENCDNVLIGYDTRIFSREFAIEIARVVNHFGLNAYVCDEPTPEFVIRNEIATSKNYRFGLIVTAGAAPSTYNGIKIKTGRGTVPQMQDLKVIENYINTCSFNITGLRCGLFRYSNINLFESYREDLLSKVKNLTISDKLPGVCYDNMNGVDWFKRIYPGSVFICSNNKISLSPIKDNLKLLTETCKLLGYVGIAHDSSSSRIVMIDENGRFIDVNIIIKLVEFLGLYSYCQGDKIMYILVILDAMVKRNKKLFELLEEIGY